MLELKGAVKKLGDKMPEDLERAILARVRSYLRKDRDRIKAGTISRPAAKRKAERAAVSELLDKVNSAIAEMNSQP